MLLVVLFVALLVWTVTSTGGGNSGNGANGSGGRTPAETITPGPTPSGSFVSSRPGGPGPAAGGDDGASGSGDSSGGDGTMQTAAAGAAGGSAGGAGAYDGAAELPAGSTMPDCVARTVSLTLRSVKNSYETSDKPQFQLIATNGGPAACKLDFGSTSAVFTIDDAQDAHIWASDDCPADRSAHLLQVLAHGQTTFTLTWNRRTSSPQCATPGAQSVPNGATYLVQAKLPGFATRQTSFFLKSA